MRKFMTVQLILLVIFLGACSENEAKEKQQEDSHINHNKLSGDIWEETASADILPAFLDNKSEDMKNLYTVVAKHQALLEKIPCYCGCGESAGHQDNYDCFIHDNGKNGAITWDDHATRCQACLDIAAESIIQYNEGTPLKTIRKMIDDKYKVDYPEPTPTPAV